MFHNRWSRSMVRRTSVPVTPLIRLRIEASLSWVALTPSISTIRSPGRRAARSAGLPEKTPAIDQPSRRPVGSNSRPCRRERGNDRRRRADREGDASEALGTSAHEPLAFPGDRATNVGRNCAVATEDLCTAVVNVEEVDAVRSNREVPGLARARRTGDDDHARARHPQSAGFESRLRFGEHVGR